VPAFRLLAAALALALLAPIAAPKPAAAVETPLKVALIVGPMGSQTSGNRSRANDIADWVTSTFTPDQVTVAKAYSPNATYSKVRAAVAGANIIVYMGHGSGYPNPYHNSLLPDRNNGWGLNTTTTNGDQDSWSNHTLVYCGEKALRGQLTSSDGADQRKYCAGGAIAPAPGFVMIYSGACYTTGANEPQNPVATNSDARAHVSYFSRPMFQLGASGYFAGNGTAVLEDLLTNPDMSYGDIFNMNMPWGVTDSYETTHQLLSSPKVWLTHEDSGTEWEYAFAGDPARTFNGGTSTYTAPTGTRDFFAPTWVSRSPKTRSTGVSRSTNVVVKFSENVKYATHFYLYRGTNRVSATVSYDPATFTATLNPSSRLAAGVKYTVKLTGYIRDYAGNRLRAFKFTFTTAH
jgi:Big-like domain-containing protein